MTTPVTPGPPETAADHPKGTRKGRNENTMSNPPKNPAGCGSATSIHGYAIRHQMDWPNLIPTLLILTLKLLWQSGAPSQCFQSSVAAL
jgi:hypothetical protein